MWGERDVNTYWVGIGCGGATDCEPSIFEVREQHNIEPGQDATYKYNWGVTATWIQLRNPMNSNCEEEGGGTFYDYGAKVRTKAHKVVSCGVSVSNDGEGTIRCSKPESPSNC